MKNIKFYIYTAVVFIGTYYYLDAHLFYDDFDEVVPYYAIAFIITFGARWFLQYLQKSKEKKED
jgi:hypothetical protein